MSLHHPKVTRRDMLQAGGIGLSIAASSRGIGPDPH